MRTANEIIDQAIRENRLPERLIYLFCLLLVGSGTATFILAMVRGDSVSAIAGAIAGTLFLPAIRTAVRLRRENILIRTLEIPLTNAETAEDATRILADLAFELLRNR